MALLRCRRRRIAHLLWIGHGGHDGVWPTAMLAQSTAGAGATLGERHLPPGGWFDSPDGHAVRITFNRAPSAYAEASLEAQIRAIDPTACFHLEHPAATYDNVFPNPSEDACRNR